MTALQPTTRRFTGVPAKLNNRIRTELLPDVRVTKFTPDEYRVIMQTVMPQRRRKDDSTLYKITVKRLSAPKSKSFADYMVHAHDPATAVREVIERELEKGWSIDSIPHIEKIRTHEPE